MLASLLPGLRDLRTPLATGYLWLVVLWLLLHQHVPKSIDQASGPIAALFELGALVGLSAVLAAVSFVAFILGSILSVSGRRNLMFRMFGSKTTSRRGPSSLVGLVMHKVRGLDVASTLAKQLDIFVDTTLREAADVLGSRDLYNVGASHDPLWMAGMPMPKSEQVRGAEEFDKATLPSAYVATITRELSAVGIQLQAKNRDFWDTYDRHRAEAQFRFSIVGPMIFIVGILAWQSDQYWWLFLLLIPLAMYAQGLRQSTSAEATLVQAVVLRIVRPPVLERMDEEIARVKEERESAAAQDASTTVRMPDVARQSPLKSESS